MYYWKRYLFIILFLVSSACQANPSEQILAESPSATGYHLLTSTGTETKPASTITRVTPSATFTPEPSPTETPIPPSATTTPTATETPITTLLFTGVIVPARCVQAALDEIGDANYPYEEVSELISGADLAIGTFNATMSDQVEHTGCIWTYQLVGSPDNADAMAEAGFDQMSELACESFGVNCQWTDVNGTYSCVCT